jgi:glutathione S-transferase
VLALWHECRTTFGKGGPFLFGRVTLADAMFAPVVTRFRTYGVELDGDARAYADAVLALAPIREWIADAERETWRIEDYEKVGS